ncbi:MAG: acyltransferase family protein [Patescibacteria group bacterium]
MRNKTMDVMLAIGIIFVVMGHNYQPGIFLLPAYTFQVAIFFFISGYFFKSQSGFKNKLLWVKKKLINLLGPYFLYNIFFAILTSYLITRGVSLGEKFTIYNFFVVPFITGHQYFLYLAAWFVPQLFLIHLVAQLLIIKDKKIYFFILFLLSLISTGFFVSRYSLSQGNLLLILGRTAFGLSFYLLGKFLNIFENKIKKYLVSPLTFFLAYILYVSLGSFFGSFNYSLVFADFSGGPFATLGGTALAILMIYIISDYIGRAVSDKSLILKIGQNTFNIMALHLLVFFSINYVFYRFSLIPPSSLSNVFFNYRVERIWFIYLTLGIGLPLLFSLALNKLKKKIA